MRIAWNDEETRYVLGLYRVSMQLVVTVILRRGTRGTAAHTRKCFLEERIFLVSIDALSSPYSSELSLTLLQGRFPILISGSSIQLWR